MSRAMMHHMRITRANGQYFPFGQIHNFRDEFGNILANSLQCRDGSSTTQQGICELTLSQANMLMNIIDFWFAYQVVYLADNANQFKPDMFCTLAS
jgi:hypothetical protein